MMKFIKLIKKTPKVSRAINIISPILLGFVLSFVLFGDHSHKAQAACSAVSPTLGNSTITVNLPSTTSYHVWSRVMASDSTNNSYYVQFDSGCPINVGDSSLIPSNTWTWLDYQDGSATTHTSVSLTAGNHLVTMIGRETGVKVDRIMLLSDSCMPTGTGDNCNVVTASGDPVIAAAGDIACDPTSTSFKSGLGTTGNCRQKWTSDLLLNMTNLQAVLPLGDTQYECGDTSALTASWEPSWGRLKSITKWATGNHEYGNACGSRNDNTPSVNYFNPPNPKGWYSYDIGTWHIIALNSECSYGTGATKVGGCGPGSVEETWLVGDLATHHNACTLAYWHEPRFSSGQHGDAQQMATIWNDLVAAGADVVLSGHNHNYERFAPIGNTPQGVADPNSTTTGAPSYQAPNLDPNGIREFVVGTGGKNHYPITLTGASAMLGTQAQNDTTYGVLKLTLHNGSYDWQFVNDPGSGSFTDAGSGTCSGASSVIDGTSPTASISSPADGAVLSGHANVTVDAADDVAVTKVDFLVDGALKATQTLAPYTFGLDTTVLSNAPHTLSARAYDAAGNSTLSNSVNVTINNAGAPPPDTVPPSVSITSPTANATVSGKSVSFKASAADNVGVVSVHFEINNDDDILVGAPLTSPPFNLNWDSTAIPDGTYSLVAEASDAAGHITDSAPVSFNVKNTNPPPPAASSADLNQDGAVDIFDLSIMLSHYGHSGLGDLDGNGVVDIFDLSKLLAQYKG
jgi:hypothetical protein